MKIRVLIDHEVIEMPIEEYLSGVIPSEMPAGWPMDALKAQSVAARTYAVRRVRYPKHIDEFADVCNDPCCCQCYDYTRRHARTDTAVSSTAAEVLVYDEVLIVDAVYHSACGGHTQNSEDVWKTAHPYLRSVRCSCRPEKSGHGVGMCQYGAMGMARRGAGYIEILKHYYTDISIVNDYGFGENYG